MSVVLVTGASTGIGDLTARTLAAAGHTACASMRGIGSSDAERRRELLELAGREHVDLQVVELDVTSQESADAAVRTVLDDGVGLDVVVHHAGHLSVGCTEAFTAEDVAGLVDVDVIGAHRVERAALPHLRQRRAGTLLCVG